MRVGKRMYWNGLVATTTSVTMFLIVSTSVFADIVEASPDHYVLKHEASSVLPPAAMWERLIDPASWWHPEHSYSGDAKNLSLDVQAGGLWREEWSGGSVTHGEVVFVNPGKQLRLDAPFGPLQAIGAKTIWTITIEPDGDGSKVIFDEISHGVAASKLDELAPAVDFVKREAIRRLSNVD